MKIKIFKKIIAALCAATMSTSIIVPTGAINYTVNLPEDQKNALEKLGDEIKKGQNTLQQIQKLYSENKKTEDANLISSVIDNFKKLDNKSIPNDLELVNDLHSEVININKSIAPMTVRIQHGENVDVKPITNDINLKIQKLLDKIDEKINKEKQEKERLEGEKRKLKFEEICTAFKRKLGRLLELRNSKKIDDTEDIPQKLNSCFSLEKKAKESLSEEIIEEYIKKSNELISMIDLAEKVEKLNRKFKHFEKFANYRNAMSEFTSIMQDYKTNYDMLRSSDNKIRKRIELVDNTSKLLDKFRYTRGLTVVKKGELSGLRREAKKKIDKLCRLRDLAIKQLDMKYPDNKQRFNFVSNCNIKVNPAINYFKCNNTNEENLKKAIVKLDNAISQFEWADDGKQDPVLEWQKQAHNNIDRLLNEAKADMEGGLNKDTTIEDLKKEFNPLLCGRQKLSNCWLYAICNTHNILKHFEEPKNDIIQNTGERDDDDFDKVENFFKNHAKLSNKVISKGGSLNDESNVLSKLGIKHTSVSLANESKDEESLKKNVNIVKTLLLKHFAKSKAPVLIGVKNIWVPFDSKDRADGNHAMVVVGLDIKSNEVAVANSNEEKIEVYDLDDLAFFICKRGSTDFIRKEISMIFTSLNNKEDFKYDNSNNTWDEFESKLLPAISQ